MTERKMSGCVDQTSRVDILGDDNLFRSGRVVDVAETGLFVELCPGRQHEFYRYNRIFQDIKSVMREDVLATACTFAKHDVTIPVDVLVPETPSGPWVWFPAEIVNIPRKLPLKKCSVAVVQFLHGVQCTDLVSLERLRWRVASHWWASAGREAPAPLSTVGNWLDEGSQLSGLVTWPQQVEAGTFKKNNLALPQDCRHVDADRLLHHLNGKADNRQKHYGHPNDPIYFVDVLDGRVSYICRNRYSEPPQKRKYGMDEFDAVTAYILKITRMLTPESTLSVEREDIVDMRELTPAVLLEIFSQLDTRTQTGLRTVCSALNRILEEPVLTGCIVITISHTSLYWDRSRLQRLLTFPVFKRLRKTTQHILVDGRNSYMDTGEFALLTDMLRYTGQKRGSQLRALHLVGLRLTLPCGNPADYPSDKCQLHRYSSDVARRQCSTYRLADFIAALGDLPCAAVHLVKCTTHLDYVKIDHSMGAIDEIQLRVDLLTVRWPLGGDVASIVWNALEAGVLTPSGKQLDMLSTWLSSITAQGSQPFDLGLACAVLCAMQSADPRPSSQYRGKEWCTDGLVDLQLRKLSPIALHFLVELAEFFYRTSAMDDDVDNLFTFEY